MLAGIESGDDLTRMMVVAGEDEHGIHVRTANDFIFVRRRDLEAKFGTVVGGGDAAGRTEHDRPQLLALFDSGQQGCPREATHAEYTDTDLAGRGFRSRQPDLPHQPLRLHRRILEHDAQVRLVSALDQARTPAPPPRSANDV